jgi:choline dehydrogenase
MIRSSDPAIAPEIRTNYLSAEADRQAGPAIVRYIRDLCGRPALRPYLSGEIAPGPALKTDGEIVHYHQRFGSAVYHAAGTCKMGSDAMAVVDERLRVRGVEGLRVADCSVMPSLVSAHTNGPVMAIAWRAADLILEDAA